MVAPQVLPVARGSEGRVPPSLFQVVEVRERRPPSFCRSQASPFGWPAKRPRRRGRDPRRRNGPISSSSSCPAALTEQRARGGRSCHTGTGGVPGPCLLLASHTVRELKKLRSGLGLLGGDLLEHAVVPHAPPERVDHRVCRDARYGVADLTT